MDDNGHGTFTASEIGAVGNNGIGVTGVEWNAQVMPVKFLDSSGNGTDSAAVQAIEYAVNHGAKVINASWGGSGTDDLIEQALQYADQHGVIVVCAAGNNGTDDDSSFFAPASYSSQDPNVISVAATDSNGALASFSNYGTGTVQLAAPGVNVYSLTSGGSYGRLSGTSMAAPLVAGTIALVESAHPTWSMSQVIDAVLDHTTPDPNLAGLVTTGGIVNAGAAVANTDGPQVISSSTVGSIAAPGGLAGVTVTFNEEVNPATFTPSQVTLTGPNGAIGGLTISPVAGSNDHQFTISFAGQTAPGTYTLTVGPDIEDWYGNEMNQNGNGVNGEASDAYVATIQQPLTLSVTGLTGGVIAGKSASFTVTATVPGGATDVNYIGTVDFSGTDPRAALPAAYTFTAADAGVHTFAVTFQTSGTQSITATDAANSIISGAATVSVGSSATASAAFLKADSTTQGTWMGTYGSQGYDVIDGSSSLPSYATITPAGANNYVWAASTTDLRGLQTSGGSSRIAATWWTTTSFTVDVDLTDGQMHDLELYFLDWDQQGRTEQVQISDASTGAVLSTQAISSFQSGVYLDYAVSGNVLITITKGAGTSNVLSGLFLDPASTTTLDLTANQSIYSPNGQYQLIMQGDGNLVEYGPGGQVIWDAGTNGNPGAYATMQGDGNLVVYSSAGTALWDSGTNGNAGAYFQLQDNGNAVIYRADGTALWYGNSTASPGRVLTADQSIYSPNGQYQLIMQGDGNLVEYGPGGQVMWNAGTWGNPGAYAIMQGDGNLVVYSAAGTALWWSGTNGHAGASLVLTDGGTLEIIYQGTVIWAV